MSETRKRRKKKRIQGPLWKRVLGLLTFRLSSRSLLLLFSGAAIGVVFVVGTLWLTSDRRERKAASKTAANDELAARWNPGDRNGVDNANPRINNDAGSSRIPNSDATAAKDSERRYTPPPEVKQPVFPQLRSSGGRQYPSQSGNAVFSSALIQHVKNCTVKISTYDAAGRPIGTGTGFCVSPDGWMYTCLHVIKGATYAKLHVTPQHSITRRFLRSLIIPSYDHAAFCVPGTRNAAHLSRLAKSFPKPGERVFAISAPLSGDDIYSSGTVKRLVYAPHPTDSNKRIVGIAITGISMPGSSGGPVINAKGEVVGIIASGTANDRFPEAKDVTYAIPMAILEASRQKYKEKHQSKSASRGR